MKKTLYFPANSIIKPGQSKKNIKSPTRRVLDQPSPAVSLVSTNQPRPQLAPTSRILNQPPIAASQLAPTGWILTYPPLAGSLARPQWPLPSQPPLAGSLVIPHQPCSQLSSPLAASYLAPNSRILVSPNWLRPQLAPLAASLVNPHQPNPVLATISCVYQLICIYRVLFLTGPP